MVRLLDRPLGYKVGCVTLVCGWFLFLLGYSIPAWHNNTKQNFNDGYKDQDQIKNVYTFGLWVSCEDDFTECTHFFISSGWLIGVRLCTSIAFIGITLSLIFILWLNLSPRANRHEIDNRSIEICCLIAGCIGIIGNIVYAAYIKKERGNHMGWAFAVNCIGVICVLAAGLLIAVSHGKPMEAKSVTRQWPYRVGTDIGSSFQQDSQLSGFPDIDNPAFTDPSQIRFTRSTRPSSNDVSSPTHNPHQSDTSLFRSQDHNSRSINMPEALNISTGQVSDGDAPPSYYSVVSSASSQRELGEYLSGGQSNPYTPQRFQPSMNVYNEVEL